MCCPKCCFIIFSKYSYQLNPGSGVFTLVWQVRKYVGLRRIYVMNFQAVLSIQSYAVVVLSQVFCAMALPTAIGRRTYICLVGYEHCKAPYKQKQKHDCAGSCSLELANSLTLTRVARSARHQSFQS